MYFIILFCLVQGFTEFLPISSQGHLIVFDNYFSDLKQHNLSILQANILAHFGSLLAVVIYYRKIMVNLIKGIRQLPRPDIDKNSSLLIYITTATLPIIVVGYFFAKFFYYNQDATIKIIGLTSIIFGIFLFIADKFCLRVRNIDSLNISNSFKIGVIQCLALIPGVSRSGAILTGMRFMGFSRKTCVFFSNILSVPVICGSLVYLIINDDLNLFFYNFDSLLIIFLSTLFSLLFIHFLVSWVNRFSLFIFILYRIIFGIFLIFFYTNF